MAGRRLGDVHRVFIAPPPLRSEHRPRRRETGQMDDTTLRTWIDLEGAHNVRDLGGLPANAGVTRHRVLLRSDALDALTDADVKLLIEEIGVNHVIDLRAARERHERGRGLLGDAGVTYSDLEIIDDSDIERRQAARASAHRAGDDPDTIMA